MSVKNHYKVSVVIPVYNEGDSLEACLNAIDNLSRKPYEVIVVDNNSTDHTKAVALRHDVRLLNESKQGVVYARNRGFNAARGNLIARIDADSILPADWLDHVLADFEHDPDVVAISGPADYYDFFSIRRFANWIDRLCRRYVAGHLGSRLFLYGANMAIKKSAWNKVKAKTCIRHGMHEDLDLAIHLQEAGLKVAYDEDLVAGISSRRMGNGLRQFIGYAMASPRTYKLHSLSSRRYMYPIIALVLLLYYPGTLKSTGVIPNGFCMTGGSLMSTRFDLMSSNRVTTSKNPIGPLFMPLWA